MSGDCNMAATKWPTGYVRFNLKPMIEILGEADALERLQRAYRDMPVDPYNRDAGRHRRLGRGLYFPWKSTFEWMPDEISETGEAVTAFYQGNHNPEHKGSIRYFASIAEDTRNNAALLAMITNATIRAEWSDYERRRPVVVGVHMVSQRVTEEQPVSVVTPKAVHQDGETYGYVHLVERQNVEAGWNVVTDNEAIGLDPAAVPQDMTLQRFCLNEPLEGFGLRDAEVAHGVEPITLSPGCSSGFRNTVLIDLTPMREMPRDA